MNLTQLFLDLPRAPRRHTSRSRSRSRSSSRSPRRLTLSQLKNRLNNAKDDYKSYVNRYYGFVNENAGLVNVNNYNSNHNAPPKVLKRLKKAYKAYINKGGTTCRHPKPFRRVKTVTRKLKNNSISIECAICGVNGYLEDNDRITWMTGA